MIWVIAATLVAAIILLPLLTLFTSAFETTGTAWQRISETVLQGYVVNSLMLTVGVGALTMFLGVSLAMLTTLFRFPGVRFFKVGLLLPLSIPSYIAAYAFTGAFSYGGPLHILFRKVGVENVHGNIMHLPGLIIVLSLVLYPYVFSTTRVALSSRYNSYLESARSLGLTSGILIRKILLPLLRPAIAGGVFLVMMEVLNDYGAMKYFGIPTFTTGIFSAWFSMGDLGAAVRLALILFTFVALIAFLESWFHRKHKVVENHRSRPIEGIILTGWKARLATLYASIVFLIAFIVPVLYLLWLLSFADRSRAMTEWFALARNSLLTGLAGATLVLLIILFTQFVRQLVRNRFTFIVGKSISVGYTIPGAIIAIGIIAVATSIDKALGQGLILTGSFMMLVFAYAVRFAGVAYQPLHSESEKRSGRLFEAARSLGKGSGSILFQIFLPLSRKGILIASSLVVIDILKELPLTLILRPFNFDTLATKAFEYADDELLYKAALPAISVIIVGLVPVLLLHRFLNKQ